MDMNAAPLVKMEMISADINLALAGLIGFGFGFMLERAGFGSAIRLTGQWYGKDWSVFRVMFTAIVTAMFGIIILESLDLISGEAIYINNTYLYPQIGGGLLMGAGFVIGGYCPGTSFVALASGKLDAIFYILGLMFGSFVFAEAWPLIESFASKGNLGKITLPQLFDWSPWMVGFLVLLIAIVGTWGANYLEKKFT
ncbi:MAG: YeeE/YedE family protein [SAR324 cluster bacterium]|nr:YeeE/YedE family protein [SAR324 cluster bacterium]